MLGWGYSFTGQVIGGSKLGTSIGFPTANITPAEDYKLIPASGVYAVRARMDRGVFEGMLNIGMRPTVNEDPSLQTIEVHLLDFEMNIYDEQIEVEFVERLRDEKKFSSIDALRQQLMEDRRMTRALFGK
jgi:riboflavin kinase/FMN adenylyltransferase